MMRPLVRTATALWLGCVVGLLPTSIDARQVQAADPVTRPVISEDVVPLEAISPTAQDGTRGEGFLRKPPGRGPFPAVVLIHGGITRWPTSQLREYAVSTWPSRFLAAGYVVAVVTYRSRDVDPQASEAVQDTLAAIEHMRRLPYVDRTSIVVNGASGGGDLALWAASSTEVAAIVAEEPASSIFMGMFNKQTPKKGERFAADDAFPIHADPKKFFTAEHQQVTRERIAKIHCQILIVQGEPTSRLNAFNGQTLIAELKAANKALDVMNYPGEPHSFAFYSVAARTPRPAVASKAFEDVNAWLRRHLRTQPAPMRANQVRQVPF